MEKKPEVFLNWCGYSLEFEAVREGQLPYFPGSAIRGAFGHALKRLVCVMRNRTSCRGCPLEISCLYTSIFETRSEENTDETKRYDRLPHPFILKVSFLKNRNFQMGSRIIVGFHLFGNAMSASPFVIRAFEEAGKKGFGSKRLPFKLANIYIEGKKVKWQAGQNYPPYFEQNEPVGKSKILQWQLVTPLRVRSRGKLVDQDKLTPRDIALTLYRRLDLLARNYGKSSLFIDSKSIIENANLIQFSSLDLHWKTLQRYSSRQSSTHSVSGIVGTLGLDFSRTPEWGALLAWAPIVHFGKGTSMGLGRVEEIK